MTTATARPIKAITTNSNNTYSNDNNDRSNDNIKTTNRGAGQLNAAEKCYADRVARLDKRAGLSDSS